MFKQVKSAVFWYYLFKFRKRVTFVALLLIIALFANIIYGDVVEYLKLKDKLQYLEIALISKWVIIIFNLVFSIYLLLTMFKNEEKIEEKKVKKEKVSEPIKEEKFTEREKEFLYKKKIRSKADLLVEK
jgi:formate-dependent nitrite reductase membrane component NrfD